MDLSGLVQVIIYLCVIGGVCWLLWWLIGYIGLPEPFNKIARAIVAIVAVLLLINMLLGFTTSGPFLRLK
jgi:uncharacterized membrane protein